MTTQEHGLIRIFEPVPRRVQAVQYVDQAALEAIQHWVRTLTAAGTLPGGTALEITPAAPGLVGVIRQPRRADTTLVRTEWLLLDTNKLIVASNATFRGDYREMRGH